MRIAGITIALGLSALCLSSASSEARDRAGVSPQFWGFYTPYYTAHYWPLVAPGYATWGWGCKPHYNRWGDARRQLYGCGSGSPRYRP
jgi:hypothetical protein